MHKKMNFFIYLYAVLYSISIIYTTSNDMIKQLNQILMSGTKANALQHVRTLSAIPNLVQLYNAPSISERDKNVALLLLLTIARHCRNKERRDAARVSLRILGIAYEMECARHEDCLCETTDKCICSAFKSLYEQLQRELDASKSWEFWENHMLERLVWLVENDENESHPTDDTLSEVMDDALTKLRYSLFMLKFHEYFSNRLTLRHLHTLFIEFIEITKSVYDEQVKQDSDDQDPCTECDGCYLCFSPLKRFLKEYKDKSSHVREILQKRLLSTRTEKEKKLIQQMMDQLNAMLIGK
jgi:hypothetical protein